MSLAQRVDQWFSKIPTRKRKLLTFNLELLLNDLKPALLIDGQLAFLLKIDINQFICGTKLQALNVGEDVFIINLNHLIRVLNERLSSEIKYVYIDVSRNLKSPQLLQKVDPRCTIKDILQALVNSPPSLNLPWNQTLVFGMLLDYPTVYYFDVDVCLNSVDLVHYEISMNGQVFTSFSFPEALHLHCVVDGWFEARFKDKHNVKKVFSVKNLDSVAL